LRGAISHYISESTFVITIKRIRLTTVLEASMKWRYAIAGTVLATLFLASASAQTVTVGFTVSRTGSLNVDSMEQLHGVELWRDQVNAAGGIKAGGKSYQVKLANYDDESNSQRVQQLYTRLILQDKADFLLGPYSSGLTASAAIVSEQNGKIMIIPGAAEGKTYTLGNKYLFQLITPANEYLTSALDALKAKDANSHLALIYADDSFSNAVASAAKAYAQKIGLKIVFAEAYAPDTADFGPIIDKVVSAKATALAGGGHYADGSTLARQLYSHKANMEFVSLLVAPGSPQFAKLGDAAYGVTFPSQWEPQATFKPQIGPSSAEFTRLYQAKYNAPPSYESASGYAAGLILQHAIEQAASLDTAKVANAMNQTELTTFFGQTKFATAANQHGLQIAHTMVLAQWQKDRSGKLDKQVVWPDTSKTATMVFPIQHGQAVVAGK
jgi:branched-chain amino acid transport system substrate-binding protein